MARLPAFADADPQGSGVRIEVVDYHRRQLAITTASRQRGCHQGTKIGGAGIRQPTRLGVGKVAQTRCIGLAESARTVRQASSVHICPRDGRG